MASPAGNGATIVQVPDAPIQLADNVLLTSATVLALTWTDGISHGGKPIIDYKVEFDQANGNYITLAENILTRNYESSVLITPGATYRFKVYARNSVGYSVASQILPILCGQVPDKPAAPTTARSSSSIVTSWTEPYDGGNTIYAYKVLFEEAGGQFSQSLATCDGQTDSDIVTSTSCSVPSVTFTQAPYSHTWGTNIRAKVIAINLKGESFESDVGSGGIILRIPDKPINVQDDPAVTNSVQIGLTWDDGANNGGSAVIDYRVLSNGGAGITFTTLETNILAREYTATSLTTGTTYTFQI